MCSGGTPKAPPPPVIPPPPPAPDVNDQAAPVTAQKNLAIKRTKANLSSFRNDLTIPGGYSGLNIPR